MGNIKVNYDKIMDDFIILPSYVNAMSIYAYGNRLDLLALSIENGTLIMKDKMFGKSAFEILLERQNFPGINIMIKGIARSKSIESLIDF